MATSSSISFDLNFGELIEEAYRGVYGENSDIPIEAGQIRNALFKLRFIFSKWASKNVRPWSLDQDTQTLTQSAATFATDAGTIDVISMVLRRDSTDTPMLALSRDDYLRIPNKSTDGRPDRYFVDKSTDPPTVYLWRRSDQTDDQVVFWRIRRGYDPNTMTETIDAPFRWWDPLRAELTYRLALGDPGMDPGRTQVLKMEAEELFALAFAEDQERASTFLSLPRVRV